MKCRALSLVAVAAGLALPSGVYACDWSINNRFLPIPEKLSFGVGLSYQPFDGGSALVPSVDLGIGLANRVVLMPAVGLCRESYDDFDSTSEPIFGGAVALKLISGEKFSLNAQSGISMVSYDDDTKYTTIPIVAAAQVQASDKIAIYFGGGMHMNSVSFNGDSESESDPNFFGGLSLMLGRSTLTGGIGANVGDDDTDIGFHFGLRLPLGG